MLTGELSLAAPSVKSVKNSTKMQNTNQIIRSDYYFSRYSNLNYDAINTIKIH